MHRAALLPVAPRASLLWAARPASLTRLRFLSASATTPQHSATASPESTAAAHAALASPSSTSLSYRVGRSASLNLPVYHRIKSGGTNKTTEVKKVEGDARALSQQLAEGLGLETKINPRTNHIIIKGFHREKVASWLAEKGF